MVSRSFLRAAYLTCLTVGSLALAVGSSSTVFAGDIEYAKACNECGCNAAKTVCNVGSCSCTCTSAHGVDACN